MENQDIENSEKSDSSSETLEEVNSDPEHDVNSDPEHEVNSDPEHDVNSDPENEVNSDPENDNPDPEQQVNSGPEQQVNSGPEHGVNSDPEHDVNSDPEHDGVNSDPEHDGVNSDPEHDGVNSDAEHDGVNSDPEHDGVNSDPDHDVNSDPEQQVNSDPEHDLNSEHDLIQQDTFDTKQNVNSDPGEEVNSDPEQNISSDPEEDVTKSGSQSVSGNESGHKEPELRSDEVNQVDQANVCSLEPDNVGLNQSDAEVDQSKGIRSNPVESYPSNEAESNIRSSETEVDQLHYKPQSDSDTASVDQLHYKPQSDSDSDTASDSDNEVKNVEQSSGEVSETESHGETESVAEDRDEDRDWAETETDGPRTPQTPCSPHSDPDLEPDELSEPGTPLMDENDVDEADQSVHYTAESDRLIRPGQFEPETTEHTTDSSQCQGQGHGDVLHYEHQSISSESYDSIHDLGVHKQSIKTESDSDDLVRSASRLTRKPSDSLHDIHEDLDYGDGDVQHGELDYEEDMPEPVNSKATENEADPTIDLDPITDLCAEAEVDDSAGKENQSASAEEDEMEEGEAISGESSTEDSAQSDDGEIKDDDCEEGEIKDPDGRKPYVPSICRFFQRGMCTWGNNCRFIHPGINDKGNYSLIDRPSFNGYPGPGSGPSPGPSGPGAAVRSTMQQYQGAAPDGPVDESEASRQPLEDPHPEPDPEPEPVSESAWERGLRHAKEMKKKAEQRQKTETNLEEKRLNLSIHDDQDKENRRHNKNKDLNYEDGFEDYYFNDSRGLGININFEARYTQEMVPYPYPGGPGSGSGPIQGPLPPAPPIDLPMAYYDRQHERDRHLMSRGSRQHDDIRYHSRSPDRRRSRRDTDYGRSQMDSTRPHRHHHRVRHQLDEPPPNIPLRPRPPPQRADEWRDPWMRSRDQKKKSRSHSRKRHLSRGSHSSYSSRSRSHSSEYSSYSSRSSYSRSSSYSSSRSRSPANIRRGVSNQLTTETVRKPTKTMDGIPKSAVSTVSKQPLSSLPPNKLDDHKKTGSISTPPGGDVSTKKPIQTTKPATFQERYRQGKDRVSAGPKTGKQPRSESHSRSRSRPRSSSVSSVSSSDSNSSGAGASSTGSADSDDLYRDFKEKKKDKKEKPDEKKTAVVKPKVSSASSDTQQPWAGDGAGAGAGAGTGVGAKTTTTGGVGDSRVSTSRGTEMRETRSERNSRDVRTSRDSRDGNSDRRHSHNSNSRDTYRKTQPSQSKQSKDTRSRVAISSDMRRDDSTGATLKPANRSQDPLKVAGHKSAIKLTLINKPSESKKRSLETPTGSVAKKPSLSTTKAAAKSSTTSDKDKLTKTVATKKTQPNKEPHKSDKPKVSMKIQSTKKMLAPSVDMAKDNTPNASNSLKTAPVPGPKKNSAATRREELLKQLKAVEAAIAKKRAKMT